MDDEAYKADNDEQANRERHCPLGSCRCNSILVIQWLSKLVDSKLSENEGVKKGIFGPARPDLESKIE
jgi:hypothetical protein